MIVITSIIGIWINTTGSVVGSRLDVYIVFV